MDWSDSIRPYLKSPYVMKRSLHYSVPLTIAALLAPLPQYPQSITTIKQLESGPFLHISTVKIELFLPTSLFVVIIFTQTWIGLR